MFIAPSDLKLKKVLDMSFLAPAIGAMAIASNKHKKSSALAHQVFTPDLSKHGQAYQVLAENNPYANVNYRQSWIQKVLSGLGFRTNYDAYLEGMNLQAQEYDNAILQKEYDEEYNSPLAQAQRERQAGLNPNLTGNVSSGEASSVQDDGNPPVPPVADDLQTVTSFAGSVLQGVQIAVGIAGSLQGLQAAKLENNSKLAAFAEDAILHVLPESYDDSSGVDWKSVENYYPTLERMYGSMMSKRQFRKFVGLANNFAEGLSTGSKKWSMYKARADERKAYYRAVSGSDYSEQDEVMRIVSGELSDMAINLFKERTYADTQTAKNDADYQNMVRPKENMNAKEYAYGYSGSEKAALDKASASTELGLKQNEKEMSDYRKSLRSSFEGIMKKLQDASDKGNSFASVAKMVLSVLLIKELGE